ncbi:unnamed protein product [Blepharisma stoltei]|uniref:TmcB/TmcC TPR repeats domain-containing protein n=1 Tax=Blepharisma stoltei TaxID=1481888 RepID=A0AAU9IRF8_9CILI|nr:unnamed protein product [Blepharisma stoltei]
MSFDFSIDDIESSQYSNFLSQSLFPSQIKTHFFTSFAKLFKIKYHKKANWKMQMITEICINTIITLQLISLTWYPNLNIEEWDTYKVFWLRLGIVSYDEICASWNIMGFCFYGTITLISIFLGSFWGLGIFLKHDPPWLLALFFQCIAFLLSTVCLIPSTMILLAVLKYSLSPSNNEEYTSGDTMNFGIHGVICAIVYISLLVLISSYSELFSSDLKHSHSKKNLKARSSAGFDLQRRWFYMFMCITYISFGDSYVFFHQIILAAGSFYMFIKSIIALQYFNPIENSIFASEFASVTITILFFIFGQIMDNAIVIVVFNIFLQPIIIIFTTLLIRKNYWQMQNTKHIKSQFDFERKFRHFFTDQNQENKVKVLNLFKKYWNSSLVQKDRLFVVWEFYYCLYLKDERLARIKLSKISKVKSSFEVDIKVWKIFNWLANRKNKLLPDIDYLYYLKDFSQAKKMDEKLCIMLVKLCTEFSSKSPKIEKLIKLTNKASSEINEITENYKLLTEKHKNLESYELYESFLENITNNHGEAKIINRKKSGINCFYGQNNEDSYLENYGKGLGVILISCSKATFGSIIYLNEKAASILKSSVSNICGTSYMTIIPPPYDLMHAKMMKKFISECVSTHIPAHQNLIFQCSDGFLLECDSLIKLSAFHNSPYFLLSFQPKNTSRHIALISSEGLIASHSIYFARYFSTEQSLRNRLIYEIVPDFQKLKNGIPWIVNHNGKKLGLVSITKKIKYRELNLLLAIHSSKELSKWKSKGIKIRDQTEITYDKQAIDQNDASVSQDLTHDSGEINFLKIPDFAKARRSAKLKNILPKTMDNTSAHGFEGRRADEKLISEEHSKPSSTFSSFSHSRLSQKLLLESKQKIRILQWVLFAIVKII